MIRIIISLSLVLFSNHLAGTPLHAEEDSKVEMPNIAPMRADNIRSLLEKFAQIGFERAPILCRPRPALPAGSMVLIRQDLEEKGDNVRELAVVYYCLGDEGVLVKVDEFYRERAAFPGIYSASYQNGEITYFTGAKKEVVMSRSARWGLDGASVSIGNETRP